MPDEVRHREHLREDESRRGRGCWMDQGGGSSSGGSGKRLDFCPAHAPEERARMTAETEAKAARKLALNLIRVAQRLLQVLGLEQDRGEHDCGKMVRPLSGVS